MEVEYLQLCNPKRRLSNRLNVERVKGTLEKKLGILLPRPSSPKIPSTAPLRLRQLKRMYFDTSSSEPSRPTECCAPVWFLSPRYGHSAMTSGIRSLSQTHEQLIVGWTGDTMSLGEKVPVDTGVSADDGASFQDAL